MKRRNVLKLLGCVPFVKWFKKKAIEYNIGTFKEPEIVELEDYLKVPKALVEESFDFAIGTDNIIVEFGRNYGGYVIRKGAFTKTIRRHNARTKRF